MKRILALLLLLPSASINADTKHMEVPVEKVVKKKSQPKVFQTAVEALSEKELKSPEASIIILEQMLTLLTYKTTRFLAKVDFYGSHNLYEMSPENEKAIEAIKTIFNSKVAGKERDTNKQIKPLLGHIGAYLYTDLKKAIPLIAHLLISVEEAIGLSTPDIEKDALLFFAKRIEKIIFKYKKLKPRFKNEMWYETCARWILLNPLMRPLKFADLQQAATYVTTANFISHSTNALVNASAMQSNFESAKHSFADFAKLAILSHISKLDVYKEKLEEKETHLKKKSSFKKYAKEGVHHFASYLGGGNGFELLMGIQNDSTINTLEEYRDWLTHGIKHFKRATDQRRALMMHGPPGNGKTKMAECLADEAQVPVVTITPFDLQSPEALRQKLDAGEVIAAKSLRKSVIYLIDEVDLGTANRYANGTKQSNDSEKEFGLHSLLTELDGVHEKQKPFVRKLFILSTNYIQDLDSALKRPGRVHDILHITAPTDDQRAHMLKQALFTSNDLSEQQQKELVELTEITEGLDRSDIAAIIERASDSATAQNLTNSDIKIMRKAAEEVRRNKEQAKALS